PGAARNGSMPVKLASFRCKLSKTVNDSGGSRVSRPSTLNSQLSTLNSQLSTLNGAAIQRVRDGCANAGGEGVAVFAERGGVDGGKNRDMRGRGADAELALAHDVDGAPDGDGHDRHTRAHRQQEGAAAEWQPVAMGTASALGQYPR